MKNIGKILDLCVKMKPFVNYKDSHANDIEKKMKKQCDLLKTAEDTIQQLRLDLKEFRSMRRNLKKKMKKNLVEPPAYEEERPPGF